ncbi:MAG: PHP domain-containing protein [Oscillospiraceae bacterium]|jgi:predicted metal-dependent phosphoesterase TrpH|nr:PHP domain-containing protein [Oscillospiraceae bacterium]
MYQYETHMHTSPVSYCASVSPEEQVRAYKDRGYAGIIVTDHFFNGNSACPKGLSWEDAAAFFLSGYERAKTEGDKIGLDVFFGMEYAVFGTEFLTYGLTPEFVRTNPAMDKLSPREFSALVRANGAYLAQAHPYRTGSWIQNPYPVDPALIDGVEIYNVCSGNETTNGMARQFARRHKLPAQAGTDSHSAELPFTSGIALREKARNIFDIIEAIKTGRAELMIPEDTHGSIR